MEVLEKGRYNHHEQVFTPYFARCGSAALALGALTLTGLAPAQASEVGTAEQPPLVTSSSTGTLPWATEDYTWLGAPTDEGFIAPGTLAPPVLWVRTLPAGLCSITR